MLETVNDMIVEDDEVMSFEASLRNELDAFVNGTNEFSLTIYDDDGMTLHTKTNAVNFYTKVNVIRKLNLWGGGGGGGLMCLNAFLPHLGCHLF